MIPDQWYPILESRRVGRRPVSLTRMGEKLVLWRDDGGQAVVMRDRCPHRGVALSRGRVRDGCIECPYHGFRFDRQGDCVAMPCEGPEARIPAGMRATTYPVTEAHGLVWLFFGEAEGALPPVPWFEQAADGRPGAAGSAIVWPQNHVRTLESNFDVHHLPFVHGSLTPGVGQRIDPYHVEMDEDARAIRTWGVLRHEDEPDGLDFRIDWKAPTITYLQLTKRLDVIVADCPIDEQSTWRYARYYQDYVKVPGLRRGIAWLALQADWKLFQVRQDLRVVETQEPRLPDRTRDRLVHADAGTAAYLKARRHLIAEAESRRAERLRRSA